MKNRLRISLTESNEEIKGTIELPGDPAFVLECLQMTIERVAIQFEITPDAVVRDLYSMVTGKVK